MKTILIATDFSAAARSAALYGVELARSFNARAILFSAWQPAPIPVSEIPVPITPDDMRQTTREQLAKEMQFINRGGSVVMEMDSSEGASAEAILKAAREKKADIIIAGMKEQYKGLRKIFGSVVTQLARKSSIPLIIVPETVRYARLATIALASASDLAPEADPHLLDTLRGLAERFHSKLYVVRVAQNRFREAYEVMNKPFQMTRKLQSLDPVYECIENKDITEGLNNFIKAYGINMLALLPHKQSRMDRWFYRSITREMIFETQVPLMVLPERTAAK